MIRVIMLGRTGNNLFQYALGRVLAKRHEVPLVMDGALFNGEGWCSVACLRRLKLQAKIQRGCSLPSRLLNRLADKHPWELLGLPVLRDPWGTHPFDVGFLDAPSDCVLKGYFQSPRYFESIEDVLRTELALESMDWSEATRKAADHLRNHPSVAVHIRRTDYVGRNTFDICGPSYYQSAMDQLRQRHEGLRFHVFSDDPEWCRQNYAEDDVEICALAGTSHDPLHDLYLMTCAHHHIIANSSYSWWAAWLAKRLGQIVLSPDRWFGTENSPPIEDKLCAGWETVSVGAIVN